MPGSPRASSVAGSWRRAAILLCRWQPKSEAGYKQLPERWRPLMNRRAFCSWGNSAFDCAYNHRRE